MATYGGCSRALHLLHQQHLQLLLVANFQSEHLVGLLPPKEPLHRQQTPGNLLKSDEINLQKSSPVKQPMAFRKLAQSRVRSILAKCFFWVKAIGYGAPNSIYIYITYIYIYINIWQQVVFFNGKRPIPHPLKSPSRLFGSETVPGRFPTPRFSSQLPCGW